MLGSSLLGSAWASIPLRLAVGITFLWAGAGKWLGMADLPASSRPVLVQMGVLTPDSNPPHDQPESSPADLRLRRLWGLALKIHSAAPPPPTPPAEPSPAPAAPGTISPSDAPSPPPAEPDVAEKKPSTTASGGYWPAFLTSPSMCAAQAWAVMVTEFLCGMFVLLGLLTRPAALLLCFTMLGAVWLDQLGPAISSGQARWGFLPNYAPFDPKAWMPILWQLSLLCSCLALTLLPRGPLSADRLLFGPRRDDDNDEL